MEPRVAGRPALCQVELSGGATRKNGEVCPGFYLFGHHFSFQNLFFVDMSERAYNHDANAKRRRYDRQLRLWGEHGQAAMEDCSICLLNGSATGTETLKNLVLPGIGSFTIVDGAVVTDTDLGNNFFLREADIGRNRAECVTALLQELNEHVSGSYVREDISEVLAAHPDFLHRFSLIVATQMSQKTLREVSFACTASRIPLIIVQTYGFFGYLRLDLGDHQVRLR